MNLVVKTGKSRRDVRKDVGVSADIGEISGHMTDHRKAHIAHMFDMNVQGMTRCENKGQILFTGQQILRHLG